MPIGSAIRSAIIALLAGWGAVSPADAASLAVSADGRTLTLAGIIQPWDHCRAAHLLAKHVGITRVSINSPGGDAWAGAYLGRLFGWAGLEAVVAKGAVAESAAGVAVIGAPRRTIAGRVGLHGPWLVRPDTSAASRTTLAETSDEMAAVLALGGMPAARIHLALGTSRDKLYLIDAAAAATFRHRGQPDTAMIQRAAAACSGH